MAISTGQSATYRLGRYKERSIFLDVAEARLGTIRFGVRESSLRVKLPRPRMIDKAQSSYAQALRLNFRNRTAGDAMSRLWAQ